LSIEGSQFEILVKPDEALNYKLKGVGTPSDILLIDTVFSDAGKGMKASKEKLMQYFQTTDPLKIAKMILDRGELLLTVEQRRRLIEDKRRRILDIIHRYCVDPSTGLPVPPVRIEQAMEQAHVSIDPFKPADQQVKKVVDALKPIMPIKMEVTKLDLRIPPEFAPKSYGVIKSLCTIVEEEWLADGSWRGTVELPAGLRSSLMESLNKITRGSVQMKIVSP
jgi:ribosome maturation protein SDO1